MAQDWEIDRMKQIVERHRNEFVKSGSDLRKFIKYMKNKLMCYGWSEKDTELIIRYAFGKEENR